MPCRTAENLRCPVVCENTLKCTADGLYAALAAEVDGHHARGKRGGGVARTGGKPRVEEAGVNARVERGHVGERAERRRRDDCARLG